MHASVGMLPSSAAVMELKSDGFSVDNCVLVMLLHVICGDIISEEGGKEGERKRKERR